MVSMCPVKYCQTIYIYLGIEREKYESLVMSKDIKIDLLHGDVLSTYGALVSVRCRYSTMCTCTGRGVMVAGEI